MKKKQTERGRCLRSHGRPREAPANWSDDEYAETHKGKLTYKAEDSDLPNFNLEPTTRVCYRVCSSRKRTRRLVEKLETCLRPEDIHVEKLAETRAT